MPITPTVLIIDADAKARQFIANTLRNEGLLVEEWSKLADFADFDETDCCLLLIDVEFPGSRGMEVITNLRNHAATMDLPIVICSNRGTNDDIINGLDAGADDYITKPFSPATLIARLHSIMRRRNPQLALDWKHNHPANMLGHRYQRSGS